MIDRTRCTAGRAALFTAIISLVACYDARLPIDPAPGVDVEPAVFGTWRCLPVGGKDTDKPATMTVAKQANRRYSVTLDDDRYEGYTSLVRGTTIANLKAPSSHEDKPWSFVRYSFLRADVLYLEILRDGVLPESVTGDLRKSVEGLAESAYEGFAVCVGASKSEEGRPTTG